MTTTERRTHRPNRLREIRRERGLTQHEVAKMRGVSHMAISHHESGLRGLSNKSIEEYARIYGVEPVEIYLDLEAIGLS